jgi:5-(carboxyamino)imidazole ribonucleotide synthase
MKPYIHPDFKVGILGGGQLGRMLGQAASRWNLQTWALDQQPDFPAAATCTRLVKGNFKNYDDVLAFGREVDVLTVEIEHVNTEALHQLVAEGKTVHPAPDKLDIIKDKGRQKQFYRLHSLPTSSYRLYDGEETLRDAIAQGDQQLPFVQKLRSGGYDGRGVEVIRTEAELDNLLPGPCLVEDLVDIDKELAVVVARRPSGDIIAYPPVEMAFHPTANLVEFLFCPASITQEQSQEAIALAKKVIEAFEISGLLAVELFLTKTGQILINEVAPRPHNSGHHTIDSAFTSQFEQHLRGILDLPLGSTQPLTPSVMVNLLGEDGYSGTPNYQGLTEILEMEGVYPHLYGKTTTKPFRKMGHVTVIDDDLDAAIEKARTVQNIIKITT